MNELLNITKFEAATTMFLLSLFPSSAIIASALYYNYM